VINFNAYVGGTMTFYGPGGDFRGSVNLSVSATVSVGSPFVDGYFVIT
jgi:hypothetical protein